MKRGLRCGLIKTLAAGLLLVTPLGAQTRKPLIELSSLRAEGLGAEEARLIGNLVRSYLSDFGEVTGYFDVSLPRASRADRSGGEGRIAGGAGANLSSGADKRPAADGPPRGGGPEAAPDYVLSGRIHLDQGVFTFILEIDDMAAGERNVLIMETQSMGEMVLRARSLVETAFRVELGPSPGEADSLDLNRDMAMGTWRGEQGLEVIRLYNSGRGIAVFSSGVRMNLSWRIAGDSLRIEQISPNTERFYAHFFPDVAAFAGRAEPLRWELRPHENRNTLRGDRIFTAPGEKTGDLLFGQRETVEWVRALH
jgi:hypothetical protein